MSVKERVMSLRLMNMISDNKEYAERIGLTAEMKENKLINGGTDDSNASAETKH